MSNISRKIKLANKLDIHKLTSGQVIIDLESAVKELVENSLDAKSTNIDITFKNYGSEFVEVSDNGTGIAENDFDSIARKYHTSKISSFDDVMQSVNTFGFRGEAISSLCYISNVKMITCTKATEPKAICFDFDNMGNIINKKDTSRQRGTTTSFSSIFDNLPVRRKIFLKNIKREFSKAVNFLQNYCIVSEGVKIAVYNIPNDRSGKRLLFSTTKNSGMLDNIVSIFGIAMKRSLIPIDFDIQISRRRKRFKLSHNSESSQNNSLLSFSSQQLPSTSMTLNEEDEDGQSDAEDQNNKMGFRLKGYISSHSFGYGRNTSDRQLFFINSRPVTLPRFARILNEVYRSFNRLQYPVIFLNVITDVSNLDINVTPDKKTVNIFNEAGLLEVIKTKLTEMYDASGDLMPSKGSIVEEKKRNMSDALLRAEEEVINKRMKIGLSPSSLKRQTSLAEFIDVGNKEEERAEEEAEDISNYGEEDDEDTDILSLGEEYEDEEYMNNSSLEKSVSITPDKVGIKVDQKERGKNDTDQEEECSCCNDSSHQSRSQESLIKEVEGIVEIITENQHSEVNALILKDDNDKDQSATDSEQNTESLKESDTVFQKLGRLRSKKSGITTTCNLQVYISCDFSKIKDHLKNFKKKKLVNKHEINSKFNPDESEESAESKLSLSIKKDDFLKMKIIGQFNLGFIIVRKSETDDMFIVDQHASDEKFNFEKLTRDIVLQSQRLISSKKLELSSVDKVIVLEHMAIFHNNGFHIEHKCDENGEDILYLKSLPMSKNIVFEESDFHELVSMLKDNQDMSISVLKNLKIGKIRSMLAMRACRSSIMIGKPLSEKTMIKVVRNLKGLDKPWNCPHGRPTMRHLTNLENVKCFTSDYDL